MLAATYEIDIIYDSPDTKLLYVSITSGKMQLGISVRSPPILFNVLAGALCVNLTFLGNGNLNWWGNPNRNRNENQNPHRTRQHQIQQQLQHSAARQTRLVAVKNKNYNHIKSVGMATDFLLPLTCLSLYPRPTSPPFPSDLLSSFPAIIIVIPIIISGRISKINAASWTLRIPSCQRFQSSFYKKKKRGCDL